MNGWRKVPLGKLCKVISGGTPLRSELAFHGGNIPWVKIGDMLQGTIFSTEEMITESGLRNSSAKLLPAGTVLISIFATIGRTAILGVDATTNQAIAGLVPYDSALLIPDYLRRFLDNTVRTLQKEARGVAQVNINSKILKEIEISLPSVSKQKEILVVLDRADELRAKRRRAISLLDELAQSAFHDLVIRGSGFERSCLLADVAEIASGITKGRKLPGGTTLKEVPYLAVANVQDKQLDLSAVKIIEASQAEIDRYRLLKNDLLLTEGGDPDKLGRGTLWAEELPEVIHQNHIFRVRLKKDSGVDPVYLNWYVGSNIGKRYFLRSAKQTTGIASINATQLKNFPLQIPSMQLQESFASRIAEIRDARATQQVSLRALDELFASLQFRAFRGEL